MPKKSKNKKKILFRVPFGRRKIEVSKVRLQWSILIILVLSMIFAQVSGFYPYVYNYARCDEAPVEVREGYYRISFDETYGIHFGSDYSYCLDELPFSIPRDPATKIGKAEAKAAANQKIRREQLAAAYDVHVPVGYDVSEIHTNEYSDEFRTSFLVTTDSGREFYVREMKKDSDFSYTNLCSKPGTENWSGRIIGLDAKGREICKVNPSKYISDYVVGINIGNTAIMLQTPGSEDEALNAEATAIFSAMEPQKN
ncbi:MAG TPA: hypothetical protein VFZ62_00245 [Candidatus Saccharimonadales bacterium]